MLNVHIMTSQRRMACKNCSHKKTQKRGSRNGVKRYYCPACRASFTINHRTKEVLWHHFIDSSSLRKLGRDQDKTHKQIDNVIRKELNVLPENGYLTKQHISHLHYRGVLCMDAKYVKVKGYETKIPFLYVIDYHSHDIIVGFLCLSESNESFSKLFRLLKEIGYPLRYVVMDDVLERARIPLEYEFPRAKIQLCTIHFLRNAREYLKVAHKETKVDYNPFLKDLRKFLRERTTMKNKMKSFEYLYQTYGTDLYCEALIQKMIKQKDFLFLYCKSHEDVPHANNLIELFNSHLEGRLKTVKGFNSFESASRFLNGWMIRRRTKKFTSCGKKFAYLNGKTSLEYVLKDDEIFKKILRDIYGK